MIFVLNIKQVAEIADLTTEAIRFYEKLGIIKPERNPENGYRNYTFNDVMAIMFCAQYQNMGFSLKEIDQTLKKEKPDLFLEKLKEKRDEYLRDIDQKQKAVGVMSAYIKELEVYEYNVGAFWFEKRPDIAVRPMINLKDKDNLKTWLSHTPMVRGCSYFPKDAEDKDSVISIFTNKTYAEEHKLPMDGCIILEERLCLCTILKLAKDEPFSMDKLEDALNYLRERGIEQEGIISGGILFKAFAEENAYRYFKVFIPIKTV